MNRPLLIAASMVLAGSSSAVLAQGTAKPAAPAAAKPATPAPAAPAGQPSKEQLQDAAFEMQVLVSAMTSDKVEAPVKNALFECLYQNNFGKISDAISKIIAQNPDKVAKRDPNQILGVMAGVCGYRPQPAAAGATPGTPAPAKPATPPAAGTKPKPQGR